MILAKDGNSNYVASQHGREKEKPDKNVRHLVEQGGFTSCETPAKYISILWEEPKLYNYYYSA